MEDSGIFAAVIENRGGKAKCSANLVVEERPQPGRKGAVPPSFLTTIQGVAVKTGQLVRFDARITGAKPLDVYWLKVISKKKTLISYFTLFSLLRGKSMRDKACTHLPLSQIFDDDFSDSLSIDMQLVH